MPTTSQSVQLVQITDTHLGRQPGSCLLGLDTDDSLQQVLQHIREHGETPDYLLASGDISNDGSVESLQRFRHLIADWADRSVWLPGNHDELTSMQAVAAGQGLSQKALLLPHWQILLLNSQVPREVGGALAESELQWLAQQLSQQPDLATAIFLHHHVLPVNCDWLDQQRVANAEQLLRLLAQHPQVKLVCSGHVHQSSQQRRQGVDFLTSPSTCIQFAPNSEGFALDRTQPGYRRFQFHADGSYQSQVVRVDSVALTIDFANTQGY